MKGDRFPRTLTEAFSDAERARWAYGPPRSRSPEIAWALAILAVLLGAFL